MFPNNARLGIRRHRLLLLVTTTHGSRLQNVYAVPPLVDASFPFLPRLRLSTTFTASAGGTASTRVAAGEIDGTQSRVIPST